MARRLDSGWAVVDDEAKNKLSSIPFINVQNEKYTGVIMRPFLPEELLAEELNEASAEEW